MNELIMAFLAIILSVFLRDYITNILPWQLKSIAKKKLLYIDKNIDEKERQELIKIREEVFKGFLADCKCEDSIIMKLKMIISFALSSRNGGNSTPRKIKNKK